MITAAIGGRTRPILRAVVAMAFAAFLGSAFRTGWTHLSTDFPNYYTAAVAVRQHLPLRNYYDWTWFARQMNYAGIEDQLGAYASQTPLTMLPMVALAGMRPQSAKRVWLTINLALLAASVGMLARSTGLLWEQIAILLFCGYGSLASNFVYGQYYVFLLFLIALTWYWYDRKRTATAGFVSGVAFGLKLYTAPLLLYFAAKRKWAAVAGMSVALACLGLLAVSLFGRGDLLYYLTHVLPRSLEGGSIDPYNPGTPAISTLLHRLFVPEPGLNPRPLLNAPWLFFGARTAVQLGLVTFTVLGVALAKDFCGRRGFAWFIIAALLLSTSTASYTFILLLAPVTLLLQDASPWRSAYLVATYILVNTNLRPVWLFPKVWLLVLLYLVVGAEYRRAVRVRWAVCAAGAVLILSLVDARRHLAEYEKEPGRRYSQIAAAQGALFSGDPVVMSAGLFYHGMGDFRKGQNAYILRWFHDNRIDDIAFNGSALHPIAANGALLFELVAHRASTTMRLDPVTKTATPAPGPPEGAAGAVLSPDGKWVAYTETSASGEELWTKDLATGHAELLAGGACNNSSPAWELDSAAIVFASDCGRAFGLPALYRAPITRARE